MTDEHGGVREVTRQNPRGFVLFRQIKKKTKQKRDVPPKEKKKEELRNFSLDCRIVNWITVRLFIYVFEHPPVSNCRLLIHCDLQQVKYATR